MRENLRIGFLFLLHIQIGDNIPNNMLSVKNIQSALFKRSLKISNSKKVANSKCEIISYYHKIVCTIQDSSKNTEKKTKRI